MSETVNNAFNKFNKEYINLDPERTKKARNSQDWLLGQLESLPSKINDFPRLFEGMHIKYGSFPRRTKIRELDDIDCILTFAADGVTYTKSIYGNEYILTVPESAKIFKNFCNADDTLNSIKLINKVILGLSKVDQYKSAEIKRHQEAAILNLSSYEWVFDIVPAFYTDTDYYLIPDGSGKWKATDPRIDQSRISNISSKYSDSRVLQLIRTLKYWNRRAATTTIPSYLFENIILTFCQNYPLSEWIDFNLRDFWNDLQNSIYYEVPDPKNFQGNLNSLTLAEKYSISQKALDAYSKSIEAIRIETENKNQTGSIRKWAEIFGSNFV
jgi:hypothetical protein